MTVTREEKGLMTTVNREENVAPMGKNWMRTVTRMANGWSGSNTREAVCSPLASGCFKFSTLAENGWTKEKGKALTGKTITLDMEESDRVNIVKAETRDKEGFPPVQHCLIYGGKQVKEEFDHIGREGVRHDLHRSAHPERKASPLSSIA